MSDVPTGGFTAEQVAALAGLIAKEIAAHQAEPAPAPADIVAKGAADFGDFLQKASAIAPDVAAQFTGKALIASKTPWGTVAGGLVAWLGAKYSLTCSVAVTAAAGCWTPETVSIVAGGVTLLGTLVASYFMRYFSPLPVTGILSASSPAQAAAKITKGTPS